MSEVGRRSGAPTIRDVARLTGVSAQTVSRVLNTPDLVQPATRERVMSGIRQLDYRRSPMARGLATNRSGAVGVVDTGSGVMGQMLLLSSVEAAAREHGYSPRVITTSDTDASLRRALETLDNERVEAIVIMGNTTLHVRGAIRAAGRTPVVLVASDEPPAERLSTISVNQAGGARELLVHLRAHGPRIGHIAGPRGWVDADARREEWRRFAGDGHAHLVAEGDWTAGSGYAAMQRLLDQGVDAVFASNDYMALGALQACRERGVSVPGDVAVAGFDDIPGADFFYPPLTTVRQPFRELGIRAVDLLAELLSGQEARSELLQAELVVRSSS